MGPRLMILNVAALPLIACILNAGWAYGQSAPPSPSASPFQSAPLPPSAPPSQSAPRPPSLPPPTVNRAPIWLPGTTIEFVEGVPAVVSMLGFVRDPDSDPRDHAQSGSLWPGFTWHPTNYTITYDVGRWVRRSMHRSSPQQSSSAPTTEAMMAMQPSSLSSCGRLGCCR
jgi:hypothetical protein